MLAKLRLACRAPWAVLLWLVLTTSSYAQESTSAAQKSAVPDVPIDIGQDPPKMSPLAQDYDVWIDPKQKLVVVDGEVCLREGLLEMFACPKGTKEHESIVTVNSKASFVHAGLLAVGAKPGHPVRFQPDYVPASGTTIEVFVLWKDQQGREHKARAQEWIRNIKTGETLDYPWVFAGSSFWTDEEAGQRYYSGDAGDFICVSNFPSATLDLPVKSSQDNANLIFEAHTERIPPLRTKVRLVLVPRAGEPEAKTETEEEKQAPPDAPSQK